MSENWSKYGGALQNHDSTVTIEKSKFLNNNSTYGGAIFGYIADHMSISDTEISGNLASIRGGAISLGSCEAKLINCNIHDNKANSIGGAVYMYGYHALGIAALTATNTDITGNSAATDGDGVYCEGHTYDGKDWVNEITLDAYTNTHMDTLYKNMCNLHVSN